jgi:hypothetical protein
MMGASGAAGAAAAFAARLQAMREADAAWEEYARIRGMHFRPGRIGWAHGQWPRVDGVMDRLPIAFELGSGDRGVNTVILAAPLAPIQGNLEITREGLLAKIAKVFGAQDVVLGDEAFDRAYLVKAAPEILARALLTDGVRRDLLAVEACRLAYDDGSHHRHGAMVVLEVPGVVAEPTWLDRLQGLVVEIARARLPAVPYR